MFMDACNLSENRFSKIFPVLLKCDFDFKLIEGRFHKMRFWEFKYLQPFKSFY